MDNVIDINAYLNKKFYKEKQPLLPLNIAIKLKISLDDSKKFKTLKFSQIYV